MKKILVADDSVTIQKVIALTFADEPFEVQSVGTGAEALEMMSNWKPDILLADVIMPQMNGYELCRAVKEQQDTSAIPVLLLAGTFEAFDEEEAKSVGADGYITKPFESGELIEKVNLLTGRKPAAEPSPEPSAEAAAPDAGSMQMEAPQVEPPAVDTLQAEPPQAEPIQAEKPEAAPPGAPAPEQVPGQVQGAGGAEPDIWDILSDTEGSEAAPESGISDAAVPGMGPIEDQGVVDVGSFDVGLDRPEQAAVPSEPQVEIKEEMPVVPSGPESMQQVPEEPPPPTAPEPVEPPSEQPVVQPEQPPAEKSRVEDREKDFFGFETEGPEAAGDEAFLGDAVEEITFEMEEPAAASDESRQEASFVVPEPVEKEVSVSGETLPPEALAPEPAAGEEPPLSLEQPVLEEPSPEDFAASLEEQIVKPVAEEAPPKVQAPVSVSDSAPVPPVGFPVPGEEIAGEPSGEPVIEPPLEIQEAEPVLDTGPGPTADTTAGPPSETAPVDTAPAEVDDAIRKVIEEKVEKVVWEVVPEMAEVLIKEAIEKIKGKP